MAADFSVVAFCLLVAAHVASVSIAQTVDQSTEVGGLEGTSVRLFCHVSNRGSYGVFWYIELETGKLLILSLDSVDYITNRPKFEIEEDLTSGYFNLTIHDLRMTDEGSYECLLSDGIYTIAGNPGTVSVLPPVAPPGDPVCSASYTDPLSEGDEISASCTTADGGRPNSQLTWQGMNGQVDTAGPGPNHTVTWDATQADDGAVYTCQEAHLALDGYYRSCTVGPLTVLHAPLVSISPTHPKSEIGDSVILTCSASANPHIQKIHWIHGNNSLPIPMPNSTNSTTSRFSIKDEHDLNGNLLSSHLNITEVRDEDFSAEITCIVWNANASGNITVTLEPVVPVYEYDYVDSNSLARNPLLLLAVDLSALGGLAVIGVLFLIAPHLGCLVPESYKQKRRENKRVQQLKREKKRMEKEKKLSMGEKNLVPIQFEDGELEMYEQQVASGLQDNTNNNAGESAGKTSSSHSRSTSLSKLSNCVVEVDNTILEM